MQLEVSKCLILAVFVLAQVNALARPYFKPTEIKAPFLEQFSENSPIHWKQSEATKVVEAKKNAAGDASGPDKVEWKFNGVCSFEKPFVYPGFEDDTMLVIKSPATHHAIARPFGQPIQPIDKPLVIQYEVKLQNLLECGGAYLKLLTKQSKPFDPTAFDDKTPYTIMFGPDKCGSTNKVHFIFRHKNPITGDYEEKHFDSAPPAKITKLSTLYTLEVRTNNDFVIYINGKEAATGNLLRDFTPPVNPPKEIPDKDDIKPADWVDNAKIPDPDAKKPDDHDEMAPMYIEDSSAKKPDDWYEEEPLYIHDPESKQPEHWNEEDDGTFEPNKIPNPKCLTCAGCGPWRRPTIKNPNYKGKWTPPLMDNPAYKGVWIPRQIPNVNYFEDLTPSKFEPMVAVGFELWTMTENIGFDNIFIGHSKEEADAFAQETWDIKYAIEKAQEEVDLEKTRAANESTDDADYFSLIVRRAMKILSDIESDPVNGVQAHLVELLVVFALALLALYVLYRFARFVVQVFSRPPPSSDALLAKRKKLDLSTPDATTKESRIENKENVSVNEKDNSVKRTVSSAAKQEKGND